jgi:hypothetical protein
MPESRLAREGRRGCIALFVIVTLTLTIPLWVPMLPIQPSAEWDRFGLGLLFFALLASRCCSCKS